MADLADQHHDQFLRLFAEHEPALRTFVRALVPTLGDASEVTQEVAVAAPRHEAQREALETCLQRLSSRSWRWLAVTAACAAVVVFVMLAERRDTPRARPDISAVTAATRSVPHSVTFATLRLR